MIQISPLGERILFALSRYKYLTPSHLVKLGVSPSIESTRRELRKLKDRGFTWRLASSSVPPNLKANLVAKRVRNEDLNYLTEKGAKIFAEETRIDLRDLRYPKRIKTTLSNDYFHRVSSISVHIAYRQWLDRHDFEPVDELLYYDKRAKFKSLKSTIETRVELKDGGSKTPDLIFGYENAKGQGRVFVVEVYNGARTKYIEEQTQEMLEVLQETTELSDRVGVKKLPRVLITCEDEGRVARAVERIKQNSFFDFDRIGQMLLFNTAPDVWDDFGSGWVNLFGEVSKLEDL